jgi:hypothetical protein
MSSHHSSRGPVVDLRYRRPATLAPVKGKHCTIQRETGKCAFEYRPRAAGGCGFVRHGGPESVEIATACRGSGVRGEKQGAKQDAERS